MGLRQSAILTPVMAGAAIMMAHQVAGKAARDGVFLSQYPATALPAIVMAAAAVAVLVGLLFSRLLIWGGPRVVVPAGFLASAAMHGAEWASLPYYPGPVAAVVYLHVVGLGAILLSGFWSLANELFDPRVAKRIFGRIAGAGTAGGILGGLLAERTAALLPDNSILLLLATFHVLCAGILMVVRRQGSSAAQPARQEPLLPKTAFSKAPYLRTLAALVVLGTASAAVVDYLFKSGAATTIGKGEVLIRFFAVFYTTTQILTFLVQTLLTRASLEGLGLGRTVRILPLTVTAGSAVGLVVPAFPVLALLRGAETILRGSLFRSGYELFYTPVPAREKRAAKTLIDVGFDRAGDAVGAGIVQLTLWMAPAFLTSVTLGATLALAAVAALVASRLDKAYTEALERGLRGRAIELDLADVHDSTTLSTFLKTSSFRKVPSKPVPETRRSRPFAEADPFLEAFRELRSGEIQTVRRRLSGYDAVDPVLAPQIIRLLAWDDVADRARELLEKSAERLAGTLADRLLDPTEEFAIRRRIPRILARTPSARGVEGVLGGLRDSRFEVRFQCARALDFLRRNNHELAIPQEAILGAIERELDVPEAMWHSRGLLEHQEAAAPFAVVDGSKSGQLDPGVEHLFSLLAAILPREPLEIAYRAIHSEDQLLLGLAFEYLASHLPPQIWKKLAGRLEAGAAPAAGGHPEEALRRLLESGSRLRVPRTPQPTASASGAPEQSGWPPKARPG